MLNLRRWNGRVAYLAVLLLAGVLISACGLRGGVASSQTSVPTTATGTSVPGVSGSPQPGETSTPDGGLSGGSGGLSALGIDVSNIAIQQDVPYGDQAWQMMDICTPKQAPAKMPATLVIHGGGGDKKNVRNACLRFASIGFLAAAINWYDSQPPAYPQLLKDGETALAQIKARPDVDPQRVASYGVSAGGYLSALLGTVDFPDKIGCVISVAGPTDFTDPTPRTPAQEKFLTSLFGDQLDNQDLLRQASPITYVTSTSANFIFLRSVNDQLVPRSQFERMIPVLQAAGKQATLVEVDGHGPGHALVVPPGIALKMWNDSKGFYDSCLPK